MMKRICKWLLFLMICTFVMAGSTTVWAKAPGNVRISAQKSNTSSKKYSIYWDRVNSATGYEIRLYNSAGKQISRERVRYTRRQHTFRGIVSGSLYKVRIRAYKITENEITGDDVVEYGKYTTRYISQQPRVSFAWVNSRTCKASWSAVEGAASYTVYRSTKRGTGYKKVKTVKKNQLKLTGLQLDQNYYVYVVANIKVGKTVYKTPVSYSYSFCLENR